MHSIVSRHGGPHVGKCLRGLAELFFFVNPFTPPNEGTSSFYRNRGQGSQRAAIQCYLSMVLLPSRSTVGAGWYVGAFAVWCDFVSSPPAFSLPGTISKALKDAQDGVGIFSKPMQSWCVKSKASRGYYPGHHLHTYCVALGKLLFFSEHRCPVQYLLCAFVGTTYVL